MKAPSEPCARRSIFVCLRSSALEIWGAEGVRCIGARMPEAARHDTIDAPIMKHDWMPETYVHAWYEAAFHGPARERRGDYDRFLDRMMDHGFGRVRRLLLSVAMTPLSLAPRCAELWRYDHTHGTLTVSDAGRRSVSLTLRDHAYLDTALSRASITEIIRHACAMTRVHDVRATHAVEGGDLVMRVTWG